MLRSRNFFGAGLGLGGAVPYGGMLIGGGLAGMGMVGPQFDLSSYYAFTQYLETVEWTLSLRFVLLNKRSHRLFIQSDDFANSGIGDYMVFECDVKVNADMYDDVWNDMFLKRMSAAYVQLAWG